MQLGSQHWPGKDRNMPGACWLANLWVPGAARDTVSKIKEKRCWCWPRASTYSQHTIHVVHTHINTHTQNIRSGQTWNTLGSRVTRADVWPQRTETIRTSGCFTLAHWLMDKSQIKKKNIPGKILLTSCPLNFFYQEGLISPINSGFLN